MNTDTQNPDQPIKGLGEKPVGAEPTATAILPDNTDMDLLKEYILECLDHIHAAEAALLDLENGPDTREPINLVFRAFHTIKGTSGFLGLDDIQALAHHAETLFNRARDGRIRITGGYADISLEACDILKSMIENLQDKQPGDALPLPDIYADLLARLKNPEQTGISAEESEAADTPRLGDLLVAAGAVSREQVTQAATKQGQASIGETLIKQGVVSSAQIANALRMQKKIRGISDTSIRLSADHLDHLVNLVGELVISQSMLARNPDVTRGKRRRLSAHVTHIGKIIRKLQDLTMSLRTAPLQPTFQKMARLVRDLGRKAEKEIRFVTEGDDTEIDRSLAAALNDPLVHMIRNACDHGVETPEERARAGKSSAGTITLRAHHAAGSVVIELIDDGKGLDRDKLIKQAVARGLIEPNAELTDSEAFMLIFKPGLSTAEQITDISGRGVGMDVVKQNLEAIRGRIEISSIPGQGSTFTLKLPLTLAAVNQAQAVRPPNTQNKPQTRQARPRKHR